jgi:cytochrome c oxidase subunit 3
MGEGSTFFSVAEVQAGFKSSRYINPNWGFDCRKAKTILSRKESELLSDARYVVEGANLKRNEYGKLFADFFSLSQDFMDFTFFQV